MMEACSSSGWVSGWVVSTGGSAGSLCFLLTGTSFLPAILGKTGSADAGACAEVDENGGNRALQDRSTEYTDLHAKRELGSFWRNWSGDGGVVAGLGPRAAAAQTASTSPEDNRSSVGDH